MSFSYDCCVEIEKRFPDITLCGSSFNIHVQYGICFYGNITDRIFNIYSNISGNSITITTTWTMNEYFIETSKQFEEVMSRLQNYEIPRSFSCKILNLSNNSIEYPTHYIGYWNKIYNKPNNGKLIVINDAEIDRLEDLRMEINDLFIKRMYSLEDNPYLPLPEPTYCFL